MYNHVLPQFCTASSVDEILQTSVLLYWVDAVPQSIIRVSWLVVGFEVDVFLQNPYHWAQFPSRHHLP